MTLLTGTGSSAAFGDPVASLFQASRAVITIDRPAPEVWKVLTDLSLETVSAWCPEVASVQRISGHPREENERVLVTKKTKGQFYMRTIRIVQNAQRVLRVDAFDGSYSGFIDHTLHESGGKTDVIYSGYIETRSVPSDKIESFDTAQAAEGMMDYLNSIFGLLKTLVEKKTASAA